MAKKFQLRERGTNEKIYPITVKEAVGLDNIDNTSDADKPVSTAQAAAIADAKKAGTDAQAAVTTEVNRAKTAEAAIQATLDDHKADNDKKHIPAGGHEKQILTWESEGKAKWEDLSNMFTGLEELLAYGVEWDVNVADPHLTRIGNMSLHKTLPIQSQLKGCIAQGDKIMYWLNEDDWNYRKDPVYIQGEPGFDQKGTLQTTFNIENQPVRCFVGQKVRMVFNYIGIPEIVDNGVISDITGEVATITWNEGTFDTGGVIVELGSDLTGYDGTVRVYCPNFYIKSEIIGNIRRVWLSTVKIDNTWTYQHEILIDAYRSTVLNTVPENMGYLSTLPVNSAISVVNTATYCRGGGNRSTYDQYLETDPCRTDLGKPRTELNRATMRTYARNADSYVMSYDQYKNIFYWLYVVEYANFNSREDYNAELTEDGYHQGGMGTGVSTWDWNQWTWYNENSPITPCGYLNELGNRTGIKTMKLITPTASGANPTKEVIFQVPRWRGFDNPFGDIWTYIDGIIIDANANNHPNNMNYVYTCQDPTKYADSLNDGYEKVGEEIHQDGYVKLFDLGDAAHIIPKVVGGDSTQYKCDWHTTGNKDALLRTLAVGGTATSGAGAGLCNFSSGIGFSPSFRFVGFWSVSSFVSFSSQE